MNDIEIPQFYEYMQPTIEVLKELGGSATIQELVERVPEKMGLSDEQTSRQHDAEKSSQTEVGYRMAWARTYLKKVGLIDNSSRGVWTLTPAGAKTGPVDGLAIANRVRASYAREAPPEAPDASVQPTPGEDVGQEAWKEELLQVMLNIPPDAFERLAQRVLRESGFREVKVTGKSGDGGIDGVGLLRLQQVLSFHVIFQCKRWKGSVPSKEIRDFRGAMVGRADKGLFITTGTFSRQAVDEATRDGAPAIDLIDGDQLCELIKSLGLGIETEMVEQVRVRPEWFREI